jgi:outer membrane protein TolC
MRKLRFLIAVLSFVPLCVSGAYAQTESRRLSIEEAFILADANNRKIKARSAAVAQAQAGVEAAKNAYLPSINFSVSLAYNGNGTITERDFSNPLTAPIPHFGNNFALEASQVIYAGGAVKTSVKISELKSQMAALEAENNRQNVRFMIVGNYMELCKLQNQLQIFESHIVQTQKVLDNMRQRYREGSALQNDIIRYELQLQNLNYSKMQLQNTKQILNNMLTSALGLPQDVIIVADADAAQSVSDEKDCDYWQNVTLKSSPVIKLAETAVNINEYGEKLSRSQRRPAVSLFAGNYLDGPITSEIPVIDKNFNYWAAGIRINYALDNLYKSGKNIRERALALQEAKKEKEAAQEEAGLAVMEAYIRYRESFSLLETKEKSVELSRSNYDTVSYRYKNGLALITDLLDASSQKLDAQLQFVNASVNIAYNRYKLKYISGTL